MNDPELYHKTEMLKADLKLFLDEYSHMIRWRPDGKDSLLDIGCAGANITIDLLHAMLPKTFSQLVGVDINPTMVNYARKHYQLPKVSFDVLDIGGDITEFLNKNERFDHITCSLCLHLVPDQKQAIENIYKLLQSNGDCLLYILVDNPTFEIYEKMDKKWMKYMEDLDDYISPYYRRFNPEYILNKYLKIAGFTEFVTKQRIRPVVCNGVKIFKDTFQSIIPFFHRIPGAHQEEFMQEFVKIAKEITVKKNERSSESHDDDVNIIFPYKLLTVFAKK